MNYLCGLYLTFGKFFVLIYMEVKLKKWTRISRLIDLANHRFYSYDRMADMEREQKRRMEELLCVLAQDCRRKDEYISRKVALSPAECRLMLVLLASGHMTIGNIARRMDVAASRITRIVDALADGGYVERMSDPADRRRLWVMLTKKGEQISDKLSLCSKDYHRKVIDSIPENKQNQLLESLELLVNGMNKANRDGY